MNPNIIRNRGKVAPSRPHVGLASEWLAPLVTLSSYAKHTYVMSGPTSNPVYANRLRGTCSQLRNLQIKASDTTILGGHIPSSQILESQIDLIRNDANYCVSGPNTEHPTQIAAKHLRIVFDVLWRKIPSALICEDDVYFHPRFAELFPSFMQNVPTGWDIIYIGCGYPIQQLWKDSNRLSPLLWQGAFWCTHCMLISQHGAEVISKSLPMHDQLDYFYGRLAAQGALRCYAFNHLEKELENKTSYAPVGLAYQLKDNARSLILNVAAEGPKS